VVPFEQRIELVRAIRYVDEAFPEDNWEQKIDDVRRFDVAVFGMGEDGHTASLFPGMQGLERAFASPRDYVAVDASGCPGAQQWASRISLTPHGISRIAHRLLLIQGARKRAAFEQAIASGDRERWPVLVLLERGHGAPLEVHWCA
jgi:6-phosphogluconolactonase